MAGKEDNTGLGAAYREGYAEVGGDPANEVNIGHYPDRVAHNVEFLQQLDIPGAPEDLARLVGKVLGMNPLPEKE